MLANDSLLSLSFCKCLFGDGEVKGLNPPDEDLEFSFKSFSPESNGLNGEFEFSSIFLGNPSNGFCTLLTDFGGVSALCFVSDN